MIIAIDGPTASGKGTLAKRIAAHFGLPHLDTGLLYRAVGRQVQLNGGDPDNAEDALTAANFPDALLDDPVLRNEETGGRASRASVHPQLRQALFDRQRDFALQEGGAVLDGRDIGTVIAPDADVKLFVTASIAARAKRRFLEMKQRNTPATLAAIEADLERRDARDTGRKDAPLQAASDAYVIDTSHMSIDEAFAQALDAIHQAMAERD